MVGVEFIFDHRHIRGSDPRDQVDVRVVIVAVKQIVLPGDMIGIDHVGRRAQIGRAGVFVTAEIQPQHIPIAAITDPNVR